MITAYLVHTPFGASVLKCNEDTVFSFKNKEKESPLIWKVIFFCFVAGCSYFLNKDLDKACSKQLRSYSLTKKKKRKKKYIILFLSATLFGETLFSLNKWTLISFMYQN